MADLAELLGDKLINGKGESLSVETAMTGKKALALYFSAHWCPPCRGFTPKLAEWYKKDLSSKGLEVVFVSSDKTDADFKSYFGEMPWLALPFEDKDRKAKLSKKFKVNGIPSMVIIGADGKTITKDGRDAVLNDPTGEDFPWISKPPKELLAAAKLINGKGESVSIETAMTGKKALALYFSAHWCPPCRGFTPQLAEWYKADLSSKGLEVIFVSSDRDEESFKEYFAEQPWLALAFEDRALKGKLSSAFGVSGIPSLVVLDADLKKVTTEGRAAISGDPKGLEMPWFPKPVSNLKDGPGDINEVTTLLLFCESSSSAEQSGFEAMLTPIAKKIQKTAEEAGEDPEFAIIMVTDEANGLTQKIKSMVKGLSDKEPQLLLMDIPDDGGYYVGTASSSLSADAVESFISDYKAGGKLERKQLQG